MAAICRRFVLPLLLLVLLGNAAQAQQAPAVTVTTPVVAEVVDWDTFTGRFEAEQSVAIRARVSGYLNEIHFQDGQFVEAGDLLFVIDPRPFEASVAQAQAEVARARSQTALLRLELERAEELLPSGAISQETVDTRRAAYEIARADEIAAGAARDAAQLDLDFTRISAPVAGRTSATAVDVGNLIDAGSGQAIVLTTIVSSDPIRFVFDMPENAFLRYARLHGASLVGENGTPRMTVDLRLLDEETYSRQGELAFIDNTFDAATGTIRLYASVPNPGGILVPGLFARLRMPASNPYEALLVPDRAILSDQSSKLVMVVNAQNVVEARVVETGPMQDGMRVIRSGLEATDRVITDGLMLARPGAPVTPEEAATEMTAEGLDAS